VGIDRGCCRKASIALVECGKTLCLLYFLHFDETMPAHGRKDLIENIARLGIGRGPATISVVASIAA
jgi:hypothetical protein